MLRMRLAVATAVVTVLAAVAPAADPTAAGMWKGYFKQVPGGLAVDYFMEAKLKQDGEAVTGEIRLAIVDRPNLFHTMTVAGKGDKGGFVLKDGKVVESKAPEIVAGRWFTERTFSGKVSEFGGFAGTWSDPTDPTGKGTFVLLRMDYAIQIQRQAANSDGLIPGKLHLNGELLGEVYENPQHIIPAGEYTAKRRTTSNNVFLQGPGGAMSAKKGDFLMEVVGVPKRTDILLHPGNKPEHSKGCILCGPAVKKGNATVAPPLLAALRRHFYGGDAVDASDPIYAEKEKGVTIKIEDHKAPALGVIGPLPAPTDPPKKP